MEDTIIKSLADFCTYSVSLYRVLDYQVGNLGASQYLVKLNARKDSTAVPESYGIWMKPPLVINT